MRNFWVIGAVMLVLLAGCGTTGGDKPATATKPLTDVKPGPLPKDAWRAIHVYMANREQLPLLHEAIEKAMAPKGLNTLILEVNYSFAYKSHPEVSGGNAMTHEDARALLETCRKNNVRLIPQFQCFGHQGSRPSGLVSAYPELLAPPNPDYSDPAHYHVSWNPLHPKTNEIVFALFDELIDAFQPEYFHVGMDEVMLFPDETTPYYNGETPAEIFAKAANDYYDYLVKGKGLTMMMWGDRLIDQSQIRYHSYESSNNGTAPAVDMIPKDIIICDWHYNLMKDYPSVRFFQEKGFRVLPASWKSPSAGLALLACSQMDATPLMLGHLCTTWCGMGDFCQAVLGQNLETLKTRAPHAYRVAQTFNAIADVWGQ